VRLEIFIAVKIHVRVFWVTIPCSDMVGYQCSRGHCCMS